MCFWIWKGTVKRILDEMGWFLEDFGVKLIMLTLWMEPAWMGNESMDITLDSSEMDAGWI